MKTITRILLITTFTLLNVITAVANDDLPTPEPIKDILYLKPFKLDKPAKHFWSADQPHVTEGWIMVLKVDPQYLTSRQTAEYVLYVGQQTAERINIGSESGNVIALVPGHSTNPDHPEYLDPTKTIIWMGAPALPEQIGASAILAEHDQAQLAGIIPLPGSQLDSALEAGGSHVIHQPNKTELLRWMITLIQEYAPQEKGLINRLEPK